MLPEVDCKTFPVYKTLIRSLSCCTTHCTCTALLETNFAANNAKVGVEKQSGICYSNNPVVSSTGQIKQGSCPSSNPLFSEGIIETTFRISCAWRSIFSDTINREIYHRESKTFTGATPIAEDEVLTYSSIPVSFQTM